MVNIRLNTKADMRMGMANLYSNVNNKKFMDAVDSLRQLESGILGYYTSRGEDCEDLLKELQILEDCLYVKGSSQWKRRWMMPQIAKFVQTLKEKGTKGLQPIEIAKRIYYDIQDDFSMFMLKKDPTYLEVLDDDFDELRSLEMSFRSDANLYSKYVSVMTWLGSVQAILPAVIGDVTAKPGLQKLSQSIITLYSRIEELFAPMEVEAKKQELDQNVIDQILLLHGEEMPVEDIAKNTKVDKDVVRRVIATSKPGDE